MVDIVEISALEKWSPLALHFDENNLYFGMKSSSELGVSTARVDLIGWDNSNFYDYLSGQNIEHFGESHNIGLSAGAYVGVGGSISIGWNLDYMINRWSEIW